MAERVRLNKVIDLLQKGKTVFCGGYYVSDDIAAFRYMADSDFDFCIVEMEHEAFSLTNLRTCVQYLLNRKRIAEKGNLQPDVVPFVRIPPTAREVRYNEWIIKQTLDTGVFGLVQPHVDTVENAQSVVAACRYRQVPGVPDYEPEGHRGFWPRTGQLWGLHHQEYYDVADLWPLDPDGELLLMGIIESIEGIANLRDILREVKGIGAIWAGPGDLSVTMGKRGNSDDPEVQEALLRILDICKEFEVPCMVGATPSNVEQRIEQGFRIIYAKPSVVNDTLHLGKKASGR